MKRFTGLCIAAAAVTAWPTFALANEPSQSFNVRVHVPEYCEINASTLFTSDGDGFASGTVFESCNTQEGFQVVASHRPLEEDEAVAFNYAGQLSYLRLDGWSQVANRTGAKFGTRPIGVQYSRLATPLAINLTITTF